MSTVLVVEDEQMLRSSMASGLGKLQGVKVLTAGTVEDALRLVDFTPPDLVLSDLDLPDRTGVELYNELQLRGSSAPVVFISAHLSDFESALPHGSLVEAHQKPVPLEELRAIVRRVLSTRPSDEDADPFSLDEYLQIAAMGRHSVSIELGTSTGPGGRAVVAVVNGQICFAEDAEGVGPDAFRRIVRRWLEQQPRVRCRRLEGGTQPANLDPAAAQSLMMDEVRKFDEAVNRPAPGQERHDLGTEGEDCFAGLLSLSPPRQGRAPSLKAAAPVESLRSTFQRLVDEGIDALLAKRFEEALDSFVAAEALCPGDPSVETNIHRLREMGYGRAEQATPNEEVRP